MPRLCAFGCKASGVPMHRFPNNNKFPEHFKSWVILVGGKLESPDDYKFYENKRVCDIHFTIKDRNRNNRLKAGAIPSLHLPGILVAQTVSTQPQEATIQYETVLQPAKGISENSVFLEQEQSSSSLHITIPQEDRIPVKQVLLEHNYAESGIKNRTNAKGAPKLKYKSKPLQPLCTKIKRLRSEVIRLRKRGQLFKDRLKNVETLSKNLAFHHALQNMMKPAQLFVNMQLQATKKPKGRRFSLEEKVLSMSLYKKSPKCYGLLCDYFTLPSPKTMKRLLSQIKLTPGINKIIFDKIKKTVSNMPVSDRLCSLIFDEMSITPQIFYNAHDDTLEGFSSNQTQQFANHVLVFMVKGIKRNFKQPIAYYFTSGLKKTELKQYIKTVIKEAQDSGLIVINTVCDQSTINVSAINELVSETKAMYLRHGREWRYDLIRLNKQEIIPIYDVPHLIKGIRNNLLTKDMVYSIDNEEKLVKWEYIQKLYSADKSYGELRLLHKLTEEHVNPEKISKMRVKLATQVFSHSVAVCTEHLSARGDLPEECKDLIPITLLLDRLFDSLNGNTFHVPNGKECKGPVKKKSVHHQLWSRAKTVLRTIKFKQIKKVGNKIRLTETAVPSVQNFIKSIEGIEGIWKILNSKYGFDTLFTRNLNQDPVENFFGNIRNYGVRNIAPNTLGFQSAFKALLLNNYNSHHSRRANCEEDYNKCLNTLDFFLTEPVLQEKSDDSNDFVVKINENLLNVVSSECDAGQSNYVCGWVLTKCLKCIVKSCQQCKIDLLDEKNQNQKNNYIKAKEYQNKKWLCYPNGKTEKCFLELQHLIVGFLRSDDVPKRNLRESVLALADVMVEFPFTCKLHDKELKKYFATVTVNLIINSWCRSVNRILGGKIVYNESDDKTKMLAQTYYNKYKHYKNKK